MRQSRRKDIVMAKKSSVSKNEVIRIVVSIIYIVLGVSSVITAWDALVRFDFSKDLPELISTAVGVMMFLSGVLGLARVRLGACFCGIIIFIASTASFILAIVRGGAWDNSLVQALLAWLFIVCI